MGSPINRWWYRNHALCYSINVAKGLSWKSNNNKAETASTEYGGLRLPNGKYNARVRAQNKAGLGPPSNEVIIDLGKSILLTLYGVYQG